MPLRLPPLASLRYFEAAGRYQSFKLAASELNVTPSAISHGILGLERTLGTELFIRKPNQLSLTREGADYLSYVSEALSLIAIGAQRLPSSQLNRPITVSCAPTFASRWLLPRLRKFCTQWPDISITIDTSHRQICFPVDGYDFAIRMSRTPVAGTAWSRLFGEFLVPVCSPDYRDIWADARGDIDLSRATLIHVNAASEDWKTWLDRVGMGEVDLSSGLRFDTIQLAFEAATLGLGVVLGRRPLVDLELANQTLIEVGPRATVAGTAYWLVNSEGAIQRPDLAHFKRWLLEEATAFGVT